jgi:hypothetical protein
MDVIDDLQLIAVVQQRVVSWLADPGQVVEVTHAELEALASGKTQKSPRSRPSTQPPAEQV